MMFNRVAALVLVAILAAIQLDVCSAQVLHFCSSGPGGGWGGTIGAATGSDCHKCIFEGTFTDGRRLQAGCYTTDASEVATAGACKKPHVTQCQQGSNSWFCC